MASNIGAHQLLLVSRVRVCFSFKNPKSQAFCFRSMSNRNLLPKHCTN